jgi:YHS domain-containing protein
MKHMAICITLTALVAMLLLAGCKTKQAARGGEAVPAAVVTLTADEAACPVLGTVMNKREMTPYTHKGKTYYMCCPPCIDEFKANPEKYIKTPAPPKRGGM